MLRIHGVLVIPALQAGETHQVGAQAEACTLAGSQADGRCQQVQQGEGHGGHDGHCQDLLHVQLLLGDDEGGQCNGQTFQEVLDCTCHQLCYSETVHLILLTANFVGVGCVQIPV